MMNDSLTLTPVRLVDGTVVVPGSKSLSNRALLLAALAEGDTLLTNLLDSDDIRHMRNALTALGIETQWDNQANTCLVKGNGGVFTQSPTSALFLGNAGTAMRPLCAVLAASPIAAQLTGEPRMLERPIGDLVDALRQAGADITYTGNEGFPPLSIHPSEFAGGELTVDGSVSSQFLTALLMASPLATTDVSITIKGHLVSKPYIDITLDSMAKFGVEVVNHGYQRFDIKAGQKYRSPGTFLVEGDASSASYFLAAAAIKGGRVTVEGVGKRSIQGDVRFADVLAAMGASVTMQDTSITVSGNTLKGVDMDMNHIPDAAMTIATTALFASSPTTIRNVYNWRVKETDRLHAMATELKKVGANVEEGHDYIKIWPCAQLTHASIDTYNDHRMAMCFALLNLGPVGITINDPGCTAKTFPDFFARYQSICHV